MAHIFRSQQYAGNQTHLEFDPEVLVLREHVFNPDPTLGCPGIYDFGRKLIHQSIYSRGPNPIDVFPSIQPHFSYSDVSRWAEDDSYIFIGLLHDHFGHFLLSTLSRLWNIQKLPKCKIISYAPNHHLQPKKAYVRDILQALDIDPTRFVSFETPVKVREIILPYACFEEQNFVHRTFAQMCNAIGDRLVNPTAFVAHSGPAYLSKERINYGVRKIVNEAAICEYLSKRGVEILFPEELSFPEQISIWRKSRPIVAFSSSGLHTSIFSPHPKMVCLNHEPRINTSFTLCDWANRTDASYFHFEPSAFEDLGPSPELEFGRGMSSELRAVDPQGVAEAVLRAIDAATRSSEPKCLSATEDLNLSRGCLTAQSSSAHESEAGGPSATSGFLTGKYQFHTSFEDEPWWQVDLGSECHINNVIVYNRTDTALDRASSLRILISQDGQCFDLVYTRDDLGSFGGLNGDAFRYDFDRPRCARFVRLSIPGPDFLHLDQVEVFGRRVMEV